MYDPLVSQPFDKGLMYRNVLRNCQTHYYQDQILEYNGSYIDLHNLLGIGHLIE
jgi:hypothetical protein